MLNLSILKTKRIFIPLILVVLIGTVNVFISNISNSEPSNKVDLTLSDVALLSHASAEWPGWNKFTSNPTKSAWRNFIDSIGSLTQNIWSQISYFFTNWEVKHYYNASGEWIGVSLCWDGCPPTFMGPYD